MIIDANTAIDSNGNGFWLINSAGDYIGLATWDNVRDSLAASPEGWIAHESGDVYVDGNESHMRAVLAAYDAEELGQ